MTEKKEKPIKKWDMLTGYVVGAIAQVVTIVMWFFPTTLKAEYFDAANAAMFGRETEVAIGLFSCNDQLPVLTNYINIACLVLSVVSLVWILMPLIRRTVMHPHNMMLPMIFNLVYWVLFLAREISANRELLLYDVSRTLIGQVYFYGILAAFAVPLTITFYNPKLKRQMEAGIKA